MTDETKFIIKYYEIINKNNELYYGKFAYDVPDSTLFYENIVGWNK